MTKTKIDIPSKGCAVLLLGGSASGKTTFAQREGIAFRGRILSADHLSEIVMRVHNNAHTFSTLYPTLYAKVEQIVAMGINARNKYYAPTDNEHRWPQNIRLSSNAPFVLRRQIATLLNNGIKGANCGQRAYFDSRIERMARNKGNILIDMTGSEQSVNHYVSLLKKHDYKIMVIWVVANRNYALMWNRRRQRCMKDSAVHAGHNAPNSYLSSFLTSDRAKDIDKVWIVFNTTESINRAMTPDEERSRCQELCKNGERFILSDSTSCRLKAVLGKMEDNPSGMNNTPTDSLVYQCDAQGREIIIDEEFIQHYTQEVATINGERIRALLKLNHKGDVVVDKQGKPMFQKPTKDEPTYPYIAIRKEDCGKRICRRHRNGSPKYHSTQTPRTYLSTSQMDDLFWQLEQYNSCASKSDAPVLEIKDLIGSFEANQLEIFNTQISKCYDRLNIKRLKLPQEPALVYDVNRPIRQQYKSDLEFIKAEEAYTIQHQRYIQYEAAWNAFNRKIKLQ